MFIINHYFIIKRIIYVYCLVFIYVQLNILVNIFQVIAKEKFKNIYVFLTNI